MSEISKEEALAHVRSRFPRLKAGVWRVNNAGDAWGVEYGRMRGSRSAKWIRHYFHLVREWWVDKKTGEVTDA